MLICTDSKSPYKALLSSNACTSFINEFITSIFFSIYIQSSPGNSDIPKKETADKSTRETTIKIANIILHVSLSSSLQVIHNKVHRYVNIERLLMIQNVSRIEKTMCWLLNYDLVTILICINVFISLIESYTQFIHHVVSKNNIT